MRSPAFASSIAFCRSPPAGTLIVWAPVFSAGISTLARGADGRFGSAAWPRAEKNSAAQTTVAREALRMIRMCGPRTFEQPVGHARVRRAEQRLGDCLGVPCRPLGAARPWLGKREAARHVGGMAAPDHVAADQREAECIDFAEGRLRGVERSK